MKYPSIIFVTNKKDQALLDEVIQSQNLGKTTGIKDMLFSDIAAPYYEKTWQNSYADYMKNQSCSALSDRIEDVYLSNRAREEFYEFTDDFQKLFCGWMQKQLENEGEPHFSGEHLQSNKNHWIYHYGTLRVMAIIEGKRVVILHFDTSSQTDILQDLLSEIEAENLN